MTTPAPIFILAPPRSFTSLICGMIGQHPALLGVPELNLFLAETMDDFWNARMRQRYWNYMYHGLLRTVAQVYAGEQTVESIEMAKRWVRVRQHRTTAQVHRELCDAIAPLRIVDKSPGYVRRQVFLERILEAFPDARFIHLLRHPRGQGASVMDVSSDPLRPLRLLLANSVDRSSGRPVLDPQIAWHDSQVHILRFLEKVPKGQWIRIRGEEVLRDIRARMIEICRFLEISDDASAIEAMTHPELSPFSCFGPINARFGNDPNFQKSPVLKPSRIREQNLQDPLPWRPDGQGFHPRVIELARNLGYN